MKSILSIYNVVQVADAEPFTLLEEIQGMIDNDAFSVITRATSTENALKLQELKAYYANLGAYLTGLWGAMRLSSDRSHSQRIAVRDYLKEAIDACEKKYEAASRILAGCEFIQREGSRR